MREIRRAEGLTCAAGKSNPQKIIANGMDWRFVNELKGDLKG